MDPLKNSLLTEALSFDDVLLKPGYSETLPSAVDISTQLGPFKMSIPILSAAMDTVTESKTAISLSLLGGLGVIHKNLSVKTQVDEVKKVKKFQNAVIAEPYTVKEGQSILELKELIAQTGVTGFPVVNNEGVLVGMCTGRDIRYARKESDKVSDVMTQPAHSLKEGSGQGEAVEFFRKYKVEKLPLIDAEGRLKALITSKDWRQRSDFPDALQDESGNLCVAAAVGVGPHELERAAALVEAGVDCLVVDSAHGFSKAVVESIQKIRSDFSAVKVIGGNVGSAEGAEALIKAGAHIVKIGIGPGSICTTRIVSGAGVPQLSAILEVCRTLKPKYPEIGFIADGGIRYSGDVTKAMAAGADAVMLGSLLAGTEESPGETILYQGRSYKSYRGMGSMSAMKKGSKDRYRQAEVSDSSKLVPEGVEARVAYRGFLKDVVFQLLGGLRSGMGYIGAKDLSEMLEKAVFQKISAGALSESHVHDVTITAEAPNYTGKK